MTELKRLGKKRKIAKASKHKPGTRYGIPVAAADEMDRVYNGALAVIAKAKAEGTWFDPFKKKEERKWRTRMTKQAKRRIARLQSRIEEKDEPPIKLHRKKVVIKRRLTLAED